MTEQVVSYTTGPTAIEAVIAHGDLSKLTPQERINYYLAVCRSLGLNELTKPFDYITLNSKLTLYATRTAADQLRKVNGVSVEEPIIEYRDDLVIVKVTAKDRDGRTDADLGAVFIGTLKGVDRANAIMKAITKAKRRVTLSICGLGWADETEVETIPNAQPARVNVETGEIVEGETVKPTNGGQKSGAPPEPEGPGDNSRQTEVKAAAAEVPADLPRNGLALLEYVNARVQVTYDNVNHLQGAIRQEFGQPKWSWCVPTDTACWQQALAAALAHANAKVKSGIQAPLDLTAEKSAGVR